jgi:hypothetical protein
MRRSPLTIKLDQGHGVIRNVSASGVYFATELHLKPGERFKFTLKFSALQIGVVSAGCEARVVRVVEPHGALKGVGAAFENIEFHRVNQHRG